MKFHRWIELFFLARRSMILLHVSANLQAIVFYSLSDMVLTFFFFNKYHAMEFTYQKFNSIQKFSEIEVLKIN